MVTRRNDPPAAGPSRFLIAAVLSAVLVGCAGAGEPTTTAPSAAVPATSASAADTADDRGPGRPVRFDADDSGDPNGGTGGDTAGPGGGYAPTGDGPRGDTGAGGDIEDGDSAADEPEDAGTDDAVGEDDGPGEGEDADGGVSDASGEAGEGDEAGGSAVVVLDAAGEGDDAGGDAGVVLDDVGEGSDGDGGGTDVVLGDGVGGEVGEVAGDAVGAEVAVSGVRFVVDGRGGVLVEGPCGWTGPLCPLEGTDPINAGGVLANQPGKEHWIPWVGRVMDLCDDHEALAALDMEWFISSTRRIDYSAEVPPEALAHVEKERRRHPVVCSPSEASAPLWKCWGDGSGRNIAKLREHFDQFAEPPEPSEVQAWAESVGLDCWDAAAAGARYVYMTANGPMRPQSSVEAAVEGYLERVAQGGERDRPTPSLPFRLGNYYSNYYTVETPADELVVLLRTVGVTDGALRGLAQNRSELLWARDVTVAATDRTGGSGQWRWPLTLQPSEVFPFEIENWAGTQTPSEIDFTITADLSPTIDLTRSLDLLPYQGEDTKAHYLQWYDFPEDMDAFPRGTAAFDALKNNDLMRWLQFDIRHKASTAHPQLTETALQQTIENLTVYAALFEWERGDYDEAMGVVKEVWEMTPLEPTGGQFGDGSEEAQRRGDWTEWQVGDWVEIRTIPSGDYAIIGFVGDTNIGFTSDAFFWAGSASPRTPPPDETPP